MTMDELLRELRETVEEQARDAGLWFEAETAPEAYLQQEMRKLHDVAEKLLSRARRETP